MIGLRGIAAGTALAGAFLLAGSTAQAAPQILGLVASNGIPTPLRCEDGACTGFVGSFCLQYNRPSPKIDSEYRLAPGGGITLIARRADGSTMHLPGESLVTLRSRIGFSSVTVTLAEDKLKSLGAVSAAIEVAPLTSLLPVAVAGDGNPQTPEDIALATGLKRQQAENTFETSNRSSDAARIVALVVNSLPADEPRTPAARQAVWEKTLMLAAGAPLNPLGIAAAAGMYRTCGAAVDSRTAVNLKVCMELQQAGLVGAMELDQAGPAATGRATADDAGGS